SAIPVAIALPASRGRGPSAALRPPCRPPRRLCRVGPGKALRAAPPGAPGYHRGSRPEPVPGEEAAARPRGSPTRTGSAPPPGAAPAGPGPGRRRRRDRGRRHPAAALPSDLPPALRVLVVIAGPAALVLRKRAPRAVLAAEVVWTMVHLSTGGTGPIGALPAL